MSDHPLRLLGFANDLTGLDQPVDKKSFTRYRRQRSLTYPELESLYVFNGTARNIVDVVVEDALKDGWDFQNPTKALSEETPAILSTWDEIGAHRALIQAAKTARLYGGALMLALTDDGPLDTPLNLDAVTTVGGWEIISSKWTTPDIVDTRFGSAAWLRPEHYLIYGTQRVHSSRVVRFDGAWVPWDIMRENRWWMHSVLDPVWNAIKSLGTVQDYMESLAHSISVRVLKIGGLAEALLAGGESKRRAIAAVRELQNLVDNHHWAAIDREDGFDVSTRSLDGLKDLEVQKKMQLVMDSRIPREKLTGEVPSGLNTGEVSGPIRFYYDLVQDYRQDQLTPGLAFQLELVFRIRGFRPPDDEWVIKWNPLWTESQEEKARVRKSNAETDSIYIREGSVTAGEVRQQRFVDGQEGPLSLESTGDGGAPAVEAEPTEQPEPADREVTTQGEDIQKTALNGAQVQAAVEIVKSVATREMPRESAIGMLMEFFQLTRDGAERVLGDVGRSFFVEPQEPIGGPQNGPNSGAADENDGASEAPDPPIAP